MKEWTKERREFRIREVEKAKNKLNTDKKEKCQRKIKEKEQKEEKENKCKEIGKVKRKK